MFRQFFKDSVIYGFSSILTRGVILLLLPLYTRVLSPVDYGIIDVILVLTNLINLTIALEISQGLARYFPEVKSKSERIGYASTALWFTVAVYTLFAALALPSATTLSYWILDSPEYRSIFQISVFAIWSNGIFYLTQNQLRWELKPKLYATTSIISTFVLTGTSVILVLGIDLGVIGVIYGQFAGSITGAALALFFTRESYNLIFDWNKWKQMVRFSLPLVPSSLGVFVSLYIDRIIIKEFMSLRDLGIFGVGYRIASIVSIVMVGFQGALTPLIYTYHHDPRTPQELARIFRYFVAIALLIFVTVSIFTQELLILFTNPEYYAAGSVLPLLTLAILLSTMYIFAPGLSITKKNRNDCCYQYPWCATQHRSKSLTRTSFWTSWRSNSNMP
ncbi:MAG: hypothetical protein KatS3mg057_0857 [Herpetosiphonaceae bacterium]|nr:MAG: hypothetical protein KatS3mg057_0857 [Herpetosiphonaceae bacterium]